MTENLFFSSDQYFPHYNEYCKAEKEKLWKRCLSHAKHEVKVFYNILKHLPVKLKWEMRPRQLHRETYPRAMGILRESQVQEITFNNLGKKTWILKRQLWNIFLVENFWKSIALDIAVHWSGPANNWFEWFSAKLQSYWDQASSLICSIIRLIREIYWILGTIRETIKVWQNFMYFVFLKNYTT